MLRSIFLRCVIAVISLIAVANSFGQQPDSLPAFPIEKISDSLYVVGSITLNSETRELILPGKVNMDSGLIELFACAPFGKIHESVLVLDIVPYHLQVCLLLLGLEYGANLKYQGDPATPLGDSVEVWARWRNGRETVLVRAEDMIYDLTSKKTMPYTHWIFSGSRMANGVFMADMEGSLITTYHDPFTIIDNPLPSGSNDELYVVNHALTPPKKTPVEVIIKALSKAEE